MRSPDVRTDWTSVSSLANLQDGEEARVQWPEKIGTGPKGSTRMGWRHGTIRVETIGGERDLTGVFTPVRPIAFFLTWDRNPAQGYGAGQVQIDFSGQVEVKRAVTKSGSTRRLG